MPYRTKCLKVWFRISTLKPYLKYFNFLGLFASRELVEFFSIMSAYDLALLIEF